MKQARPVLSRAKPATLRRPGGSRFSLQTFLPYQLNVLAQVVSDGFSVAYSDTFGISPPEWRVLATLGEYRQMTAKEIGRHSRMHKTQVSRAVLSLERRRLLVRSPNAADRREEILSLTADGRNIYEAVEPMAVHYQQRLMTGLSDEDRAALERLIVHLMDRAGTPWRPDAAAGDAGPQG